VAELLTRQRRFLRGAEPTRDGVGDVDDSCHQESPLATRVTMGVIGGVLLLASASAMSAIIAMPTSTRKPPTPPQVSLVGEEALRPDLVTRAQWPFAPGVVDAPSTGDGQAHSTEHQGDGSTPANPTAGSVGSALTLVGSFYRLLGTDSHQAVSLVSADLLRPNQAADVARAWENVVAVHPGRVRVMGDGSVVAEVSVDTAEGGRLALRHRFAVELGAAPRITAAALVAATYSPPR
jgi:hypothetical protein